MSVTGVTEKTADLKLSVDDTQRVSLEESEPPLRYDCRVQESDVVCGLFGREGARRLRFCQVF